ncbi:predicted protein [Histoplasma capsulatum var. duboisii H88]|uniref:Predicted protein n=2 Tax=Ajellomyces capsulatus TaxID=5037 RepID=F0U5M2_AJEC8|nr:predicted protein [Histoplasma capsulatum H143]EGC42159.1 predicted protein [Histoplasma capsulatum var. duboisii H88]
MYGPRISLMGRIFTQRRKVRMGNIHKVMNMSSSTWMVLRFKELIKWQHVVRTSRILLLPLFSHIPEDFKPRMKLLLPEFVCKRLYTATSDQEDDYPHLLTLFSVFHPYTLSQAVCCVLNMKDTNRCPLFPHNMEKTSC